MGGARMTALRAIVTVSLGFALVSAPLAGDAQQATKISRVGLLRPGAPPDPYVDAFRQGLRDLGYVERESIALEYRWAEGKSARLPLLAAELVRLNVDVIVTQGEAATRAAKEASSTIPSSWRAVAILLGAGSSPALPDRAGMSPAQRLRPGGSRKQLQLFKEAVPTVSRVAILPSHQCSHGPQRERGAGCGADAKDSRFNS